MVIYSAEDSYTTICALQTALLFSAVQIPFRSCSAVQDEGLVCGGSADSNAGLSERSTKLYL